MMVSRFLVLLAATSVLAACKPAPTTAPATDNNAVASADNRRRPATRSPAPKAPRRPRSPMIAAIVSVDAKGAMTTLREGKNGWTCMPDSPTTPGPDPMCMDGNAMKWAGAWMGHKPPPPTRSG